MLKIMSALKWMVRQIVEVREYMHYRLTLSSIEHARGDDATFALFIILMDFLCLILPLSLWAEDFLADVFDSSKAAAYVVYSSVWIYVYVSDFLEMKRHDRIMEKFDNMPEEEKWVISGKMVWYEVIYGALFLIFTVRPMIL